MSEAKRVYTEEQIRILVSEKNEILIKENIDLRGLLSLQKCSKENILLSALRCYKLSLTTRIKEKCQKKNKSVYPFWLKNKGRKHG